VRTDSPLLDELRSVLGPDTIFEQFRWSGANSHVARLSAAANLRAFLKGVRRKNAPIKLFVVAHSHGGNIALYAAHQMEIGVDAVVCLGTPFIRCVPRSFPDTLLRHVLLMGVLMAPVSLLFLSILFEWVSEIRNDILGSIIFAVLATASLIVILYAIWFVCRLLLNGGFREFFHPVERMRRFFQSQAYRLSDLLTVSVPLNLRVFAAWTEPDEAFAVLHVSDKMQNALFRIASLGFSDAWDVVNGLAALIGGAYGVWWWLTEFRSNGFWGNLVRVTIVLPINIYISMGMALILALVARHSFKFLYPMALPLVTGSILLRRIAYDFTAILDGFLAEYLCQIEVTRIPSDSVGEIPNGVESRCYFWALDYKGQYHSLHSNREVIGNVAEWFGSQLSHNVR
jgi:pimeloyl-ACP methyl ester carboxylesterase